MSSIQRPFGNRPHRWWQALLNDIHFWVPAGVLLLGVLFLRWVR
jgi:hypothetical protein